MNVVMALLASLLFTIGTYLVLQRKLSRIIIGLGLLSHGGNVLLIISGHRGLAPLVGTAPNSQFSDPMPQALALTAIVITFGVTAFLLALAYRSWILTADDEVEDDVADRMLAVVGAPDEEVQDEEVAIEAEEDLEVEAEPATGRHE